jgi:two-component system OmpR family response regulator
MHPITSHARALRDDVSAGVSSDGLAPPTIGVCEDDDELRGILRDALRREGITVWPTVSGTEAVELFTRERPDVLVLDIGLPDADGRDVCQALRARGVDSPVLFLTARGSVPDRISGFHAGGDDYLTKPFSLAELLVRVNALLRRRRVGEQPAEPTVGFVLDPGRHAVRYGDREEALTPTEFRVLGALATGAGDIVRRQALISAAWPEGAIVHDNTLHVYLARIRRKLHRIGASAEVENVRGVGYRLR